MERLRAAVEGRPGSSEGSVTLQRSAFRRVRLRDATELRCPGRSPQNRVVFFFFPQCLFQLKFGCAEEAPRSAQRCADRGAGAGQGSGSASWPGAALRLSC